MKYNLFCTLLAVCSAELDYVCMNTDNAWTETTIEASDEGECETNGKAAGTDEKMDYCLESITGSLDQCTLFSQATGSGEIRYKQEPQSGQIYNAWKWS